MQECIVETSHHAGSLPTIRSSHSSCHMRTHSQRDSSWGPKSSLLHGLDLSRGVTVDNAIPQFVILSPMHQYSSNISTFSHLWMFKCHILHPFSFCLSHCFVPRQRLTSPLHAPSPSSTFNGTTRTKSRLFERPRRRPRQDLRRCSIPVRSKY